MTVSTIPSDAVRDIPPPRARAVSSAESVAALRAATARVLDEGAFGRDPYARHFLGPKYRLLTELVPYRLLRRWVERQSPGSLGFSLIRTREFDGALARELERGVDQVVCLGAGYDTRALRFADELAACRFFEVDEAATQARKQRCLARSGLEFPQNVAWSPADFNRRGALEDALQRAGFDAARKTLFLWEGVSYYLPESGVREVLQFVRSCARGSSIVFDYAVRAFVEGDHSTFGGREIARWLSTIGEPFRFGLDPRETAAFLTRSALTLEKDDGPDELEQRHLGNATLGLSRTLGHVRIAHARVQ